MNLNQIAPDIWMISYPLKMLGVDLRRNVTILRLASGKLIVHSTAPFTTADVAAIHALGEPCWLLEVLLRHDTFSREGTQAFAETPYLVPEGFVAPPGITTQPLVPPPAEWREEIAVLTVEGAPAFTEIVLFHRPSGTLVVGDLLVNFSRNSTIWTRFLMALGTVGGRHDPGMTRPFKQAITDRPAFARSIRKILDWDIERIIVGHGEVIPANGREILRRILTVAGIRGL